MKRYLRYNRALLGRYTAALLAAMALVAAFGILAAKPALAQGRPGMSWSGNVDSDVIVYIHQGSARTDTIDGHQTTHIRTDFWGRLPDRPVRVFLVNWQGRGFVRVVQQPRPDNGFTAGVEIRDPQPGRGDYSFTLSWTRPFWGGRF